MLGNATVGAIAVEIQELITTDAEKLNEWDDLWVKQGRSIRYEKLAVEPQNQHQN